MAQEVELLVRATSDDPERLKGRIMTLTEVGEVADHEEHITPDENPRGFDMGLTLKGARRSDVEELLLGVDGVEMVSLT